MPRKPTGNRPGRRPRTDDGTLASANFRLKLTPAEHAEIVRRAAKYESVADFVRKCCLVGWEP